MRRTWREIVLGVVSPVISAREVRAMPSPVGLGASVLLLTVGLGALTLPRQLQYLGQSLAHTGNLLRDGHHAAVEPGLTRLIVVDRLLPPPTLLLSALLLSLIAEPVLSLAEDQRRAVRAVLMLGLVPLLFQRMGEAAITYAMPTPPHPLPGWVVTLPQQFVTGPAIFWSSGSVPTWMDVVSLRINIISVWSVALWAIGLRELDSGRFALWHLALPAFVLCLAGVATWWLEPMALSIILGGP